MKTLLQIHSSLNGERARSSRLANALAAGLLARHPGARQVVRDLAADPVPHLDGAIFQTFVDPSAAVTAAQKTGLALSDALIEEVRASDVMVIGAPMYNFGIPSTLKAWIDHITRTGVTFRMTDTGPEGFLHGKKAFIVITRGGSYLGTPADLQTAYLEMTLALIGIVNVEFIHAEGLAMGADAERAALAEADHSIQRILDAA